ncbi:MAG: TIR domain-containing protein [Thermoanaerobaculia bacterium]|nr:TIR domain-containing protein [Thermoanaerobaculia bacterium]
MPRLRDAEEAFDVFLCHNSADKPAVAEVAARLCEADLEPWLDVEQLRPGFPWQRQLELQIRSIRAAAVFVGPSGIGPWQEEELDGFLREFQKRGCPVIPVLLPGCPSPPELPVFLGARTWVDFRVNSPDPLEQLIWGITSKKPERRKPLGPPTPALDLNPWLRHVHAAHSRPIATFRRHRGTALSHLYVELRIAEHEVMELWRDKRRGGEKLVSPGGRWTLEEILALDPEVNGAWITRRWLLYGEPGSGKTTLLRHLAATLADPDRGQEPRWIPVFESLPRFCVSIPIDPFSTPMCWQRVFARWWAAMLRVGGPGSTCWPETAGCS